MDRAISILLRGFHVTSNLPQIHSKNCWKQLYLWWNTLRTWRPLVCFPPCAFLHYCDLDLFQFFLSSDKKKIKHQGMRKRKIFPIERENNSSIPKSIPVCHHFTIVSLDFLMLLLVFLQLIYIFKQASFNKVQKMKIWTKFSLPPH